MTGTAGSVALAAGLALAAVILLRSRRALA
jgi:hypothetical protein